MDPRIAHSLYQALRQERTVFAYSGAFHDEHTARLIALGEAAVPEGRGRPNARGRLAFIMVEAYQNILRHRAVLPPHLERGEGRSLFLLRSSDEGHCVVAVNPVLKSDVARLRQTLHKLHGLAPDQLKSLFLSGLQDNSEAPRRGAGLGLIEMARRSGSDLGYMLRGLGADHELFILAVRIGEERTYDGLLSEAAVMHGTVVQNDLLLLHIGERPAAVQEAVLRMVEEDLLAEPVGDRAFGRAYLAANGCMDEASPAASRSICAITRQGAHVSLAVGKLMPGTEARRFAEEVDRIRGIDRLELERRYRNALLKRDGSSGMADLLDLARLSVEPLEPFVAPGTMDDAGQVLVIVRAVV